MHGIIKATCSDVPSRASCQSRSISDAKSDPPPRPGAGGWLRGGAGRRSATGSKHWSEPGTAQCFFFSRLCADAFADARENYPPPLPVRRSVKSIAQMRFGDQHRSSGSPWVVDRFLHQKSTGFNTTLLIIRHCMLFKSALHR